MLQSLKEILGFKDEKLSLKKVTPNPGLSDLKKPILDRSAHLMTPGGPDMTKKSNHDCDKSEGEKSSEERKS